MSLPLSAEWVVALVQRPPLGPDSPFGDLLGYIIIFFVVVWPILRGLLENAKKQREEFESKRSQAGPRSGQGRGERGRRTLEEILEGKLERIDSYDEPPVMPAEAPPQPAPRVERRLAPESKLPAFGDRPADEAAAPVYTDDDLLGGSSVELGSDPFDEASLEQDLVSKAALAEVPTEGEVEANLGSAMGPMQRRPGAVQASPIAPQSGLEVLRSDDPEAIYRGMGRPLSPWQKAFILKEVLGQPLASRPAPTLSDLPG